MKLNIKNKQKLLIGLVLLSILVITVGVTYAFFSYTKQGVKDNTITTGTLTFLYTEIDKVGAGIEIEDALPMSDSLGKVQTGDNKVFNFKINADTTSTTAINYEITARKSDDSTLDEKIVKLYLTKVNESIEEEVLLNTFDKLDLPTKEGLDTTREKLLYKGKVPSDTPNYEQSFRLRMWIDEKTDFSGIEQEDGTIVYPYNDKTFKINVNVYADGNVLTQEDIDLESSADYTSVLAGKEELTQVQDETLGYQYELDLQNVDSTTITVNTKSEYAKVEIEKLDSLENIALLEVPNVKRLATSKVIDLTVGDNYFKVTITSEDKKNTDSFIIKIHLEKTHEIIEADSILDALSNENLTSGYYNIKANGEQYPVHLYVLEGDQTISENTKFGDSNDVGTATEYAKNMIAVKVKGNLTINEGITVEPYYTEYGGPKGFTLYVDGTLTNNGTIDNSHGAYAEGQNVYLYKNSDGTYETVPATGALGGQTYATAGSDGTLRQTGGGGAAGIYVTNGATGPGGNGTSYSGGTGSGGGDKGTGKAGSSVGGAGGNAVGSGGGAGGGAGNPGGTGVGNGTKGANGTGGLLIIYSNILTNNGNITANGAKGGTGNQAGGSSGGGSINIFYNSSYEDNGIINADGGASAGWGGAGGSGSAIIGNLNDNIYVKSQYNFNFIDESEGTQEQKFIAPTSGYYKLETWGAQGGSYSTTYYGGYGAYSVGTIQLDANEELFINVGGAGSTIKNSNEILAGGYNGGGYAKASTDGSTHASGGGSTHIALRTGVLNDLENYLDDILIVSGGGGGSAYFYYNSSAYYYGIGGSGGGIIGVNGSGTSNNYTTTSFAQGGTQENGGSGSVSKWNQATAYSTAHSGNFGAGSSEASKSFLSGGGSGYYGGGTGLFSGGAGGSSYIGNSLLTNKVMYCYNCKPSDDEATKTISTINVSEKPIANYAKKGNGYARITYLGE